MKHPQLSLIVFSTLLVSCKIIPDGVGGRVERACTLVGSRTVMQVKVTSHAPLPTNLAAALNGSTIRADECETQQNSFENSVIPSADRKEAMIEFILDSDPENYERYFPMNATAPNSEPVSVRLYERSTCNSAHRELAEVSEAAVSWQPIYANGEDCGASGFTGSAAQDIP